MNPMDNEDMEESIKTTKNIYETLYEVNLKMKMKIMKKL